MKYLRKAINDGDVEFLFFKKENFVFENIDRLDDLEENNMYFVILELDKIFYKSGQSHDDIKGIMLKDNVFEYYIDEVRPLILKKESILNESLYGLLFSNDYMVIGNYNIDNIEKFRRDGYIEIYKVSGGLNE